MKVQEKKAQESNAIQRQATEAQHAPSRHAQIAQGSPQAQRVAQFQAIANGGAAPVQRQAEDSNLPSNLRSGIESLSGVSMSGVKVHYNSSKPAQLQAHAYAQGRDIHIAPGQERHLPHEAWHVVQQAQGRVKPTLQLKGVAINDDNALEREADVMGARALGQPLIQRCISMSNLNSPQGPVQRITIESVEINTRRTPADNEEALDSLEVNEFFEGDDAQEQAVIDEYLKRLPNADFTNNAQWKADIKMRTELVKGMTLINRGTSLFEYNFTEDEWRFPDTWEVLRVKQARNQSAAFKTKGNTSRLTAVRDLFRDRQDNEDPYFLDCSTAIMAVHYRAIAEAMENREANSFDGKFGANDVVIAAAGIEEVQIGANYVPTTIEKEVKEVAVSSLNKLLPGDWVYFENLSDYEAVHKAAGTGAAAVWAGEHAVYMGQEKFQGFGTEVLSHDEMVKVLIRNYNRGLVKAKQKDLSFREDAKQSITGKLPGITKVLRAKKL